MKHRHPQYPSRNNAEYGEKLNIHLSQDNQGVGHARPG